jgi:hypothetical protein
MPQLGKHKTMRTITLEEHYATPAFMEGPGRQIKDQAQGAHDHPQVAAKITQLIEQLCDLDERRIADMDACTGYMGYPCAKTAFEKRRDRY